MAITLISTVTVGAGGAASIDFTSIPSTYTDLMVVYSMRAASNNYTTVTFNGSSSSYSVRVLRSSGSAASSFGDTSFNPTIDYNSRTASTFGNGQLYIPNYASATNKSISIDTVEENNATAAFSELHAGLWSNTAAITQVTLTGNGTIQQYSSASLYGVTKGSLAGVTVA